MNPYTQLSVMKRSGLTREEQWEMLNAKPSVRTVAQVRDLLDNQRTYGLSNAQAARTTEQLLGLGNDRTGAENRAFYLGSERIPISAAKRPRMI